MTNEENMVKLLAGLNMIANHLTYIEQVAIARLNSGLIHKERIAIPIKHLKEMRTLDQETDLRNFNYTKNVAAKQFMLQLYEKGLIKSEVIKKEFNI